MYAASCRGTWSCDLPHHNEIGRLTSYNFFKLHLPSSPPAKNHHLHAAACNLQGGWERLPECECRRWGRHDSTSYKGVEGTTWRRRRPDSLGLQLTVRSLFFFFFMLFTFLIDMTRDEMDSPRCAISTATENHIGYDYDPKNRCGVEVLEVHGKPTTSTTLISEATLQPVLPAIADMREPFSP